ncbi:carbohydrate ABC transporter permease [Pseudodesulfovibrio indicus]|uniref:Glucose ABC transporter membrane protein /mannose ABC transporter membrane protein n=1 Tax=Pseudodesulfovibrio indicus TaxID=1716143 RepID=A0A126QRM9_9BACT|nr:sugar ABC transporter permease [Pseudodesulfovibrio indicus]AMK12720.1 glucose transporter [Pseudodesulfovibrio indicus]TDT86800.1 glucose ABC transporter membrane protein /mannose ABC transporter membrane protein [Pseudodesulfovibrio indicus]
MREASRDKLKAFLTLLPSMILIGVFVYGFIGNTIWTSMTDWGGMGALALEPEKNFIGLENYIDLFTGFLGGGFRQDLVNAVYYSVLLLAGAVGLGMFIAILLDQKPRGEDVLRTIFLYPMSLSFIVSGTIWRWLLAPQGGVNVLPTYFGFKPLTFSWLSSQSATLVFNWQDLLRILIYIAAFVLILVGLFLLRKDQGRAIKRWLVPGILLGAFVWLFGGIIPDALFMEEEHGFNLATLGIIMATIWQYSGYTMALYLAGFNGISQDLRDAAMLDGASQFGYYRFVAIPMLKPITISAVIILSHISLKMFDLIFAMTGPDNAETGHPALTMYLTTFRANDFARGAAIAIVLFLIAAMFIVPYLVGQYRQRGRR